MPRVAAPTIIGTWPGPTAPLSSPAKMCVPVLWQPRRGPARLTTGPAQTLSVRYFKPEEALELPVHEELAAPGRSYSPGDHTLPWREAGFTFRPPGPAAATAIAGTLARRRRPAGSMACTTPSRSRCAASRSRA